MGTAAAPIAGVCTTPRRCCIFPHHGCIPSTHTSTSLHAQHHCHMHACHINRLCIRIHIGVILLCKRLDQLHPHPA